MKKYSIICFLIGIVTTTVFAITLSHNIVARLSTFYLFHFNDTNSLAEVRTVLNNEQMADVFSDYLNNWNDEGFQVKEYTGYDYLNLFSDDESYNMSVAHNLLKKDLIICIVCFILSAGIFIYLILYELTLMKILGVVSSALAFFLSLGQYFLLSSAEGLRALSDRFVFFNLSEDMPLAVMINDVYFKTAGEFAIYITLVTIAVILYISFRFTRSERMFS